MQPSRFSEEQIKQAIAHVKGGTPLVDMCRKLGVTQTTFYRWRAKYETSDTARADEARVLRDENRRLKQLVADLYLDRQVLRESLAKQSKRGKTHPAGG